MGLGNSRQKLDFLPEQHTDFIFAILGEELGFVGAIFVILLFFLLAWRGYKVALTCPDAFGSLLAVGITTMVVFQAFINM
jgi:cell division protein FtsW